MIQDPVKGDVGGVRVLSELVEEGTPIKVIVTGEATSIEVVEVGKPGTGRQIKVPPSGIVEVPIPDSPAGSKWIVSDGTPNGKNSIVTVVGAENR